MRFWVIAIQRLPCPPEAERKTNPAMVIAGLTGFEIASLRSQ